MFLTFTDRQSLPWGFPRIRGDVPQNDLLQNIVNRFSPHTRGCSEHGLVIDGVVVVFPAYAGMFLKNVNPRPLTLRFPRIRGDVPLQKP